MWARDKPHALPHVGDITWGLHQHEPELASPKRTQIFERDGAPVAFGILWLPQTLQSAVHPEHRDDAVYDALLEWFQGAAGEELDGGLDAQLLESDQCSRRRYGATASRRSRAPTGSSIASAHSSRRSSPRGFRTATGSGTSPASRPRAPGRRPSRRLPSVQGTVPGYRHLRTLPPYREELDLVVEAPDRSFAAYALVWLDEENGVGELEPVGTHPAHQRLGLGKAVCLEACRRLRAAGADTAVVYSVHGYHAGRLYASAGFECVDRQLEYRLTTPGLSLTSASTRCLTP